MTAPGSTSIFSDQRVFPELATYPLYAVRKDQADAMYDVQKFWWASRIVEGDELKQLLQTYSEGMDKPYLAPVGARIKGLAANFPQGRPVRVIELGGANGALMHWWSRNMKDLPLRYTGIEPFKPCVEHAKACFPESDMIHGDAEAFLGMDLADRAPYTAFVAATVFCMIHPDIVRQCILKAATLTDDLLIRDYIVNIQGGIAKDGTVLFDYWRNPNMPMMFAHRYEDYFAEIGFKVVHLEEARTEVDLPGFALVHVQRAAR